MDFLSSFAQAKPPDQPVPEPASVEFDESDSDDPAERVKGAQSSDESLRLGAISTPIHHINWECSSSCLYGRQCASNAGFLPFVVKLRNTFWGPKGSNAPSSSNRRGENCRFSQKFLQWRYFSFWFHLQQWCVGSPRYYLWSSLFQALGSGKTRQWVDVMERLVHGDTYVEKLGRPSFKHASVRAYITMFLTKCDIPPSKNMQHIKIVPFPNLKQFYEEYSATFGPSFLVTMGRNEGLRYRHMLLGCFDLISFVWVDMPPANQAWPPFVRCS